MANNKQETALRKSGSNPEFWNALANYECYDTIADDYDAIDWESTEGIDMNGEPVNLGDYPVRQRPPVRPSY